MIKNIDVTRSLLWRHNEATNLQALINNKQAAIDELNTKFWNDWVSDVFNLDTANMFGLSVWSIILDIPLTIEPREQEADNSNFGFGSFRKNFGNGNFTSATNAIIVNEEDARRILKLRYYQLITRGTIPECNKIVADVFGDLGAVYALDGLDMTMTYIFNFQPSASIRFILDEYDILPRPAGVLVNKNFNPGLSWGFGEFRKNFNNGNFRP